MREPQTSLQQSAFDEIQSICRINGTLENQAAIVIDNPVLDAVENGELNIEQWQEFIKQRHLAALDFEGLLESGIRRAAEINDQELGKVLDANLRDERGISSKGKPLKIGPHSKWRTDFYEALEVDATTLFTTSPLAGTQDYNAAIRGLIERENALTIAGALLFQEYSIPFEFKRIQTGRDITFPSLFIIDPNDTTAQRREKLAARLYLDHHIAHDANLHYPALLNAIFKHLHLGDNLKDVINGIFIVSEAKKRFYDSLSEILLK